MNNLAVQQTKTLPKLQDLVNLEVVKSADNELMVLLNQDPPKEWIKRNEMANNTLYLPIDKVEFLLSSLFIKWSVQVIDFKLIANSVSVHIRLTYQSPLDGEIYSQDGLGAAPLQTDKGAGATDFDKIKNAAVQMALPAAESYAIKDAAEKIGRIFGKDLNRKDLLPYAMMSGRYDNNASDFDTFLENCKNMDDLKFLYETHKEKIDNSSELMKKFADKRKELETTKTK